MHWNALRQKDRMSTWHKARETDTQNDRRSIEGMTIRENDNKTDTMYHKTRLVKMSDIISGNLKIDCNQLYVYLTFTHQMNRSQQIE